MTAAAVAGTICALAAVVVARVERHQGPTSDPRPRVVVSSDIGGTDPDDIQKQGAIDAAARPRCYDSPESRDI